MIFERPPISLALIMCGLGVASAATACTDRRDPLASPTAGVVLRFGNSLSSNVFVSNPGVHRDGTVTLPVVKPEVKDVPHGKFDQWGGRVIFIEPDGRGGQRICRVETWESRSIEPTRKGAQEPRIRLRTDSHGKVGVVAYKPTPAQERNPVLAPLLPYYFMSGARGYFYDKHNNIVEVATYRSPEVDALNKYPIKVAARRVRNCFNYRDGKVVAAARPEHEIAATLPDFSCDELARGDVSYREYKYNSDGTLRAVVSYNERGARDKSSVSTPGHGGGGGTVRFLHGTEEKEATTASFRFSASNSVTSLYTTQMDLFMDDAQPLYAERSTSGGAKLRYSFPDQAVPLSAMDNKFANLERYPRIKMYSHRSGMVIYEMFDAGARTPRQRQWRALDLSRQEFYSGNGKLTRVIHFGSASPDAYKEDLRAHAESGVLKVTPTTSGYASYRVYDYNTRGKESLVFVCWEQDVPSNRPLRHFPWWTPDPAPKRGEEEALIYGMTKVANQCGTPDGKMLIEGLWPIKEYMATTYGYDVEKLSYGQKQ